MTARRLQLAAGALVAALFLWLTLRQVHWPDLAQALGGVTAGWLVLAPVFLLCGYLCRILRWQAMLRLENPSIGMGRTAVAFLSSIAANNLLPLRAGDVLRCVAFPRWLGVPIGPVTAGVLVERLLDMAALILALALALWLLAVDGSALGLSGATAAVLAGIGLVAVALLACPELLRPVLRGLAAAASAVGGPAGRARAEAVLNPAAATLTALSGRHALPALMGWTVLAWAFEAATYWAVARAIPALVVPEAAWLAMPVGTLSTLLPSTPGHLGTFDFFAQAAALAMGNPLAAATAFALVVHLALWLPTTLAGSVCLVIWAVRGRQPKERRA